jgi:predicted permease
MDSFRLDLKYAVRALINRPGFSALAVLTLALGLGVNTMAFSALNALLYKPTSMTGVESLGWILGRAAQSGRESLAWSDYRFFAEHNRTFDSLAVEGRLPLSLRRNGTAEQVWSLAVSANYFSMLGVRPERGRVFDADDARASEITAVASHRFWTDRLGAGDELAGRRVTVNGQDVSIIGVLHDDFQGPGGLFEPDLWILLERIDALNANPTLMDRGTRWLTTIGRLRPGVTVSQVQADLDALSARLAADFPGTHKGYSVWFAAMEDGHPAVRGLAPIMWIGLAVVGLVLLIACFNVASLLLSRASERRREIGVRSALGASRTRVLRQLVTEATLLALVSGAASLILAVWSADLLATFSLPAPIPQRLHLGIDLRLIGYVIGMVAVAGLLPALIPALQATRIDVLDALRHDSAAAGTRSRTRNAFVVAQVAGSTLFLAAALLFVRSYWNRSHTDPGFETARTLVLELSPTTYGYSAPRSRVLLETLLDRVRALPGIASASLADRVPFYVGFPKQAAIVADDSDCSDASCRTAVLYEVGTQHFATLGVRLVAGREFDDDDLRGGNGVIVSETAASRLWPDRQALGQWLRLGADARHVQVIGVAANITHRGFEEPPQSFVYVPLRRDTFSGRITLVARASGEPGSLAGSLRAQLQALDPALPPAPIQTMAQRMEMPLWPARTLAGLLIVCGALAVTLATVGLFGVTYFAVSQRTREFGIRAALGATPRAIMRLVLRDGLYLALPGIAIGVGGALVAGRALAHQLYGVSPADALTFGTAAALQLGVALLACALPARRATTPDPIQALRQD